MNSTASRFINRALTGGLAVAVLFTATLPARAQTPTAAEAKGIAEDAYIYGYSLVTMEMTRRVMTNVSKPEATRAPMGNLLRVREYPTAEYKDVTAPNADTLYTTAWIDVSKEPWVLSLPDAHDRYYLFPMLDGWTDVFQVPGSAPPALARKNTPSPVPAGKVNFPRE